MTLDPQIERLVRENMQEGLALDPQTAQRIIAGVQRAVETFSAHGLLPVVLASPGVRRYVRQLVGRYLPQMAVLSHNEIADGVKIHSLGVIRWNDAN
jgi:flagellar biosynthesis protein FlhA